MENNTKRRSYLRFWISNLLVVDSLLMRLKIGDREREGERLRSSLDLWISTQVEEKLRGNPKEREASLSPENFERREETFGRTTYIGSKGNF